MGWKSEEEKWVNPYKSYGIQLITWLYINSVVLVIINPFLAAINVLLLLLLLNAVSVLDPDPILNYGQNPDPQLYSNFGWGSGPDTKQTRNEILD